MTLQEILNAHKGYLERSYNEWRRTRWLGAVIVKVFTGENKKPSELMPLPGDDEAAAHTDKIDEIKELRQWLTEQ